MIKEQTRSRSPLLLSLACLLGWLGSVPAQAGTSGAIKGQVVDVEGTGFPFVDVYLESETGTFSDQALSDDVGYFRFQPVPVGTYKLHSYASGFSSTKYQSITVTPGRTLTFELKLQPAESLVEEVVVDARFEAIVDTKKTAVSMTLDSEFIEAIPLQNKRIEDIVMMFAGVTRNGSSDSADISIAGGASSQIGYRLNGVSINDPVGGGKAFDISTGSIKSFTLISGGFQAEYGQQSTGIAEIITKSGTNEISFSYEISFRDEGLGAAELDGLDEVQKFWDEAPRGVGTILEDRIATGFALMGIDPLATREDDNNPSARTLVRHTVTTGGPIIRDKMFFHVTVESVRDDSGSNFAAGLSYGDQILVNTKIDWQISKNNTFEISTDSDFFESSGFSATLAAPSTDRHFIAGSYQISGKDTHILNDTTFLEGKFQLLHKYNAGRPAIKRAGVGTRYQISLPPGGWTTYTLGDGFFDGEQAVDKIALSGSVSKILGGRGQHSFKAGVAWEYSEYHLNQIQGTDVADFRISDDGSGGVLAGAPNFLGREITHGAEKLNEGSWAASMYLQDKWNITDNLTVDYSVRGDYQDFVGELFLSPRVGFSLDPIGDGKTRVFGNWGLFTDNLFSSALQWEATPDQFFSNIQLNRNQEVNFDKLSTVEAYRIALATDANQARNDPDAIAWLEPDVHNRFVLDDNLTAPTSRDWSIGIERRLPANMRIQATYREAKRTHQLNTVRRTALVPVNGGAEVRDLVQTSNGQGRYRGWTIELQKPFSQRWQANANYTQARVSGPIPFDINSLDPNAPISSNGILGNDRTHVAKLQGTAKLPWKVDLSADFTWQTGRPITAQIIDSDGRTTQPFGQNTQRLPSSRQINLGLKRGFSTNDGKIRIGGEFQLFNLLNELNVFAGRGTFEVPNGGANPLNFLPLRPKIVPTGIDVPRSFQMGLTLSF